MATKDQRKETRDERKKEIPNSKLHIPNKFQIQKLQFSKRKKRGGGKGDKELTIEGIENVEFRIEK